MQSAAIKPLRNKQVAFAIYAPGNTFPSIREKSEIARLFQIDEKNRERERKRAEKGDSLNFAKKNCERVIKFCEELIKLHSPVAVSGFRYWQFRFSSRLVFYFVIRFFLRGYGTMIR